MGSSISVAILGPLEVATDDRGPVALGGLRQRALLAILVLHAGKVVPSDRLVDLLWGEQAPARPLHTVQVFVSRLRRALGPAGERLVTRQPGYVLMLEPDELDAAQYEHLAHRALATLAAGEPGRAAALLHDAEALWRGAPLCDFTYEPFAQATIASLEELHATCREGLIDAEMALGHHGDVIPALEALVREQPFRERPYGQLMLALYRCGRQADALDTYQQARRALLDELGMEPGTALRGLEQAILRQEPSLNLPPAAAAATAASASARPATNAPVPADPTSPSAAPGAPAVAAALAASPPAPESIPSAVPTPPDRDPGLAIMRKTVTVVVSRLVGAGRLDPETAREAVARARQAAAATVDGHGGSVVSGLGGEMVAVFGLPRTREDDALRALRAAEELRTGLAGTAPDALVVHVGVDTGEVVGHRPDDIFGAPLDGAIAVSREAAPDAVLISDATYRLAANAIQAQSGERPDRWRLTGFIEGASLLARHADGPMIGRDTELAVARDAFERAEKSDMTELVTVVGDAGIGKSRLAHELTAALGDRVTVLMGRCLAYGDGVAFWPLREALAQAAGAGSREAIRDLLGEARDADIVSDIIAAAVGLAASEGVGEQVPWAFRRGLEILAAQRPVLLILDDAHWAPPPLLDLVEHLVDWMMAPVVLVCLARPELLDARPRWGGGHPRMRSVVLGPLSERDALALLDAQAPVAPLEPAVKEQVLRRAEGNPLFVEQLLAMSRDDPRWHEGTEMPATMHSLLAARIDRLSAPERALLERAAVVGREFWVGAVLELLPAPDRAMAGEHLQALIRRGMVEPVRGTLPGEQALRFHHILIQDVAYRSTAKGLRAELHERFAGWLPGRAEGTEEFVGYHLEQAVRYRVELGADAEVAGLAAAAAAALAVAGRRALGRGETQAGIALLARAADLDKTSGTRRPGVLLDLGSALLECGEFDRAEPALAAALSLAEHTRADDIAAHARIERSYLRALVDPSAGTAEMQAVAARAIAVFKRSGDEGGLARAWLHMAEVHWTRLRCAEMETVLERALRHADIAGEHPQRSRILRDLARATVIGPRPVPEGVKRCRRILERAGDDVPLGAVAETMLAVLEAMAGDFETARKRSLTARRRLEDVGLTVTAAVLRMYRAFIEVLADTPRLAIPDLVEACTLLENVGERRRLATTAALLARLLYADGRYEEAQRFSQIADATASKDDIVSLVVEKGTLARLAARGGRGHEALRLADAAVDLAAKTDFLSLHADALAERAEVLALIGRPERAAQDWERAVALYERKGNTAGVARVRAASGAARALTEPLP